MITIYHNPRCSKSRQGLAIVQDSGGQFIIKEYIKTGVTESELDTVLKQLSLKPIDLVRKNEAVWKEHFKGKELTDQEIIKAMVVHPKLIERPIVISNNKGVIGRPPENIRTIL